MKNNHYNVNKFWADFRETIINNNVSESEADWYVKWCEKFAVSIKGKSLRQRTANDKKIFLLF